MIIKFGSYVEMDTENEYHPIRIEAPSYGESISVTTAKEFAEAVQAAIETAENRKPKRDWD